MSEGKGSQRKSRDDPEDNVEREEKKIKEKQKDKDDYDTEEGEKELNGKGEKEHSVRRSCLSGERRKSGTRVTITVDEDDHDDNDDDGQVTKPRSLSDERLRRSSDEAKSSCVVKERADKGMACSGDRLSLLQPTDKCSLERSTSLPPGTRRYIPSRVSPSFDRRRGSSPHSNNSPASSNSSSPRTSSAIVQ